MFIRSSTAINDCLIALDSIYSISKTDGIFKASTSKIPPFQKGWFIEIMGKLNCNLEYQSQEARDKAFEELCAFLNSNYKLRDFT